MNRRTTPLVVQVGQTFTGVSKRLWRDRARQEHRERVAYVGKVTKVDAHTAEYVVTEIVSVEDALTPLKVGDGGGFSLWYDHPGMVLGTV